MKIIKRSGSESQFDMEKIISAVIRANDSVAETERMSKEQIAVIAANMRTICEGMNRALSVEEIQDLVENQIMNQRAFSVARNYITYRYKRALVRKSNSTDEQILSLLEFDNEEVKQENSNKNPAVNSVQRDYMAGEVSKDITKRFLLPSDIVEAHEKGLIHFHDADYFAQHMHNCCLVNLDDMLENGTVISETMIEKPHSFSTACNVATQAVAQIASSQYGGQSISLSHLVPFVQVSREKYRKEVAYEFAQSGIEADEETINKVAELRVQKEVKQGVQMIQYQVITLMTTNGQAPFITIFMYLNEVPEGRTRDDLAMVIEEVLKQRIQGIKNEKGVYITPAFPKLIYVLEEDNIHEDSKYWYLTRLAAECTAKRMVPDYISEKIMFENKVDKNGEGHCYPCMGCRSFLTPYVDPVTNEPKYYGRFNQGVVTVNLVDVACSSQGDMDKFWKIFDERLELCHRALVCRHERLEGTPSDVAPILWQHGALARLKKGETIDKLLHLFIVSEDASLVPFKIRKQLVMKGTAHLKNICYHDSGPYIISNATFPSYFQKDENAVIESHAMLDLTVFTQIAKVLGITRRYVGEEPTSLVTGIYNRIMSEKLPEQGIECIVVPRKTCEDTPISASNVRLALQNGDYDTLSKLVPQTTLDYFKSPEAIPVIERIRQQENVIHY